MVLTSILEMKKFLENYCGHKELFILISNQRKAIKKLNIAKYWPGCWDIGTPPDTLLIEVEARTENLGIIIYFKYMYTLFHCWVSPRNSHIKT